MAKNIVIFSDGTGQMGGEQHNSNVYKLFNMVESRTQNQVVYYDPGLGTDLYRITGTIFGRGISKNIKDCYRFIFQHYESGDKIFLFGFSRGAATVRSLSGFLHMFGILPGSREDLVDKAFAIYRISDHDKRKQKAKEFIAKHHNHWCMVEFLGVWDTVASLGVPLPFLNMIIDRFLPHKFHNFDLSESVRYARHAISIDEERSAYKPVLWNRLKEDSDGRMKQVWFSGVHSDVGGGYEQEKESDLSNIALIWMMLEAFEKGLLIHKECTFYKMLQELIPDPDGYMHDEQLTFPGKLFGRISRSWNQEIHGELVIHESVFSRKKGRNNSDDLKYEPWVLKMNPYKKELWKKNIKAGAA